MLTANAKNVTLSTTPAAYAGLTTPVTVRGTKINAALSSRLEILITDNAGNTKVCDPISTLAVRETGKPVSETFTNVLTEEGWVKLTNGTPGVTSVVVRVNGKRFAASGLRDGEERLLDISAAMQPGDANTITITAQGKPSGSVDVMIWDGQ